MISTAELTDIRSAFAETHSDTCNIMRRSSVPDNAGGTTDTWPLVGAPLPCRVASGFVMPREALSAARMVAVAAWFVYVSVDADIQPADMLAITTSRGSYILHVTGIRAPRTFDFEKVIEAQEID